MAKLLAVETSTSACSVAISIDDRVDERFVIAAQEHTQRLLPMIDEILKSHQLSLENLDAIAYSSGPGSFTGLRIGLGVVQGLAFGARLPLVKVSSLAILARGIGRDENLPDGTLIIPAFNARMSEVYWGLYRYSGGMVESLIPDAVGAVEGITINEVALNGNQLVAVGDGWQELEASVKNIIGDGQISQTFPDFYPHAMDLIEIATPMFSNGNTESPFEAAPTYIRNKTTWKKRQKIRS